MRTLGIVRQSLPADWYYDQEHYRRELRSIWYQDWICVGRAESLKSDGDYFVARIGTQEVIVTRRTDGELAAFHNTCRHRGSILCRNNKGHFRNGRIICPYHTWTYSLDGALIATPGRLETDDFDEKEFSLYDVHIDTWGGFIFINLLESPTNSLAGFLGDEADLLRNWPLEEMRSVKQETFSVECNWKIFWENYCECYHCPRVHPELCKVMPVYREGVFDQADLPGWKPENAGDIGRGAVGNGAMTWTKSGKLSMPQIDGPDEEELAQGVVFAAVQGSMYVVGHPDYVRSVRILPTGPESIDLVVDWLLLSDHATDNEYDLERVYELGRLVVQQDSEVCELNQRGIHSDRHECGVLVAQEYELWNFHEYLRERLNSTNE